MKINTQVIFLIAIVGIITAGVVCASVLSNGSMKQVDFDGIKVSVPSDAEFVKTGDGYADSRYGITIHTFKNNNSIANYLKSVTGAHVIALKNQPPQSLAFAQGDDTNVVVTNGAEGICIGAKDQSLASDMANSVVFSNHQKSVKPQVSIPGIAPPPHLVFDVDFNHITNILAFVNNPELNVASFQGNITEVTIYGYNNASDSNQLQTYTAPESGMQNTTSDSAVIDNNNQQQNTSLLDDPQANNVVSQMSSDNSGNGAGNNAPSSSNDVAPSISSDGPSSSAAPSSSSPSSGSSSSSSSSSAPSSGGNAAGGDSAPDKISESQLRDALQKAGYVVQKIQDKNGYYLATVKDPQGHVEKLKFDYNGQQMGKA